MLVDLLHGGVIDLVFPEKNVLFVLWSPHVRPLESFEERAIDFPFLWSCIAKTDIPFHLVKLKIRPQSCLFSHFHLPFGRSSWTLTDSAPCRCQGRIAARTGTPALYGWPVWSSPCSTFAFQFLRWPQSPLPLKSGSNSWIRGTAQEWSVCGLRFWDAPRNNGWWSGFIAIRQLFRLLGRG